MIVYCLVCFVFYLKDIKACVNFSGDFPYPIIADPNRKLATELGMLDPDEVDKETGNSLPCRAVSNFLCILSVCCL